MLDLRIISRADRLIVTEGDESGRRLQQLEAFGVEAPITDQVLMPLASKAALA